MKLHVVVVVGVGVEVVVELQRRVVHVPLELQSASLDLEVVARRLVTPAAEKTGIAALHASVDFQSKRNGIRVGGLEQESAVVGCSESIHLESLDLQLLCLQSPLQVLQHTGVVGRGGQVFERPVRGGLLAQQTGCAL